MQLLNYTEGHLLDEMRKFDLRFSRVAGGRIYFAYTKTGDEWIYFKTWDSVRQYIESRKEKDLARAIEKCPDEVFAQAMDNFDRTIARTDPWAFKEFVGHYPTKADKEAQSW